MTASKSGWQMPRIPKKKVFAIHSLPCCALYWIRVPVNGQLSYALSFMMFDFESLGLKRKFLKCFIKRGSYIENRKFGNFLTERKAGVFDYTLIYPQGCIVVLTDDFTWKVLQNYFFPITPFSISLSQCHCSPSFCTQPAVLPVLPNLPCLYWDEW